MSTNRHTIATTRQNGNSNIPLRRQLSRQGSNSSNNSTGKIPANEQAHRWKQKYEDSEEKRKGILSEKEKALRSLNELEKKHLNLQVKHEQLETELFEKNEEFTKLSTASKNLYKEYETLKNQYETETGAMARALKDASQWYKENKELKRQTLLLAVDKDAVDEGVDAGEATSDSDLENLNKTIKHLSTEVAELQTELDAVRQTEFQTLEQNAKLTEELEIERHLNKDLEARVAELNKENEQILRVAELMRKELEDLKELEENQRNNVVTLRKEASDYKRERNVLAHQSTILLQGMNDSNGTDCMVLLQEIEDLKRTLEDERNKHEEEVNSLQERLEDQDDNSQLEILEERLNLVESELQTALDRAEKAEARLRAPPLPPPPPPPPPPPLPTAPGAPPVVPLRRRRSRATVQEIAETIGVQETSPEKKAGAPGVNEDIINAIKEGKFTLKKAKNGKAEKKEKSDTPKAVSEILNILGSLRRAPKKRASLYIGDVQL